MQPDRPPGRDVFDGDLSVAREAVDCLGVWLAVWSYRLGPGDAHARRCASDAIAAADDLLAATYRIRARLVTEVRDADDQADARADELLARTREGPPGRETGDGPPAQGEPPPQPGHRHAPKAAGMRITRDGDRGRAPREAAP